MHLYAGGSLKVTDAAAIGNAFWSNGRKTAVRESRGHNEAPADREKVTARMALQQPQAKSTECGRIIYARARTLLNLL